MQEPYEILLDHEEQHYHSLTQEEVIEQAQQDLKEALIQQDDLEDEESFYKVNETIDKISQIYADSFSTSPSEDWLKEYLTEYSYEYLIQYSEEHRSLDQRWG